MNIIQSQALLIYKAAKLKDQIVIHLVVKLSLFYHDRRYVRASCMHLAIAICLVLTCSLNNTIATQHALRDDDQNET